MTKQIVMFGPRSLDRAIEYALKRWHPNGYYVWRAEPFEVLRAPDRRYAVCRQQAVERLKKQGFKLEVVS